MRDEENELTFNSDSSSEEEERPKKNRTRAIKEYQVTR